MLRLSVTQLLVQTPSVYCVPGTVFTLVEFDTFTVKLGAEGPSLRLGANYILAETTMV